MVYIIPNTVNNISATVSEDSNIQIKSRGIWYLLNEYKSNEEYPAIQNNMNSYKILRYYAKDRFSFEKDKHLPSLKNIVSGAFFNINNSSDVKMFTNNNLGIGYQSSNTYNFHWSNWNDVKFSNINTITTGNLYINPLYSERKEVLASSSTVFMPHDRSITKKIATQSGKFIEFYFETEYYVSNVDSDTSNRNLPKKNSRGILIKYKDVRVSNSWTQRIRKKVLLYFPKIDQIKPNLNLVYVLAETPQSGQQDFYNKHFDIQAKSVITPYGKLDIVFKRDSTSELSKPILDGKTFSFLGTISVADYSSYDFDSQKMKISLNNSSQKGILVPYNYYGNWDMKLDFSLNSVFKDMKVNVSQNFEDPILDKHRGKIKLDIQSTNSIPSDIDPNLMYSINSGIFDKLDEEFQSIIAINRRVEEEMKSEKF